MCIIALKESVFGVILVRVFPDFPAFGLSISLYLVQMQTRITPSTDSFYAVYILGLLYFLFNVFSFSPTDMLYIFSKKLLYVF